MALSDIIAVRQAALAPAPREQRLTATKTRLEALITWAYACISDGRVAARVPLAWDGGTMDGDILVFTPDADLATELREWLAAEGVKCALAWDSDTRGVLNVSVLLAPDPEPVAVVEPVVEPVVEVTP